MDTMKNIHPIYNIKVGWSVSTRAQFRSKCHRLYSCPMKMFSILVLDHLTETNLSGFERQGSTWSWGRESDLEIHCSADRTCCMRALSYHIFMICFSTRFLFPWRCIRHWWLNGSCPKTRSCAHRTGNASCPSSAIKTWPSAGSRRRRA